MSKDFYIRFLKNRFEMKLRIIIKGRVHNVGYRVKLITIALEYGIDKFNVFNTFFDGEQAVVCLVEDEDKILDEFKKRVKEEKPEKAMVEEIRFEDYGYDIPPIERCMQVFQMEHWGKAIPILLDMRDKQEETMRVIREESEKTRQELGAKIENVGNIVKEGSEKTREEISDLRFDLREYFQSNLRQIQEEIAEIKLALRKAGIM